MSLKDCRVVLVRPSFPGNVGATARVMRNFGYGQLTLVAPKADLNDREARRLSTHGEEILDQARVVDSLAEAIADCVVVAGTSARTGKLIRGQFGPPEAIMPHLATALSRVPVALVFGPETNGLTNEEVTCCHHLITIPADPAYPALNLAQAVTICLYLLRRECEQTQDKVAIARPASFADQERMFEHLRGALEEIHFLYGPKADALMHSLRHVIGRARPTDMEVGVLFGLARQIHWYAAHHRETAGPLAPEEF
ncbi:MAG TPA: RNA methyltransferase [Gemmataceae bacterium]|nr:RNA methyltransferase [Gemmataceae bacterium]